MYAPWVEGDTFLACFDRRHNVALLDASAAAAGHSWALPAVRRAVAEPFEGAARRLARAMAPEGAVRLGAVTGRIPSRTPGAPTRRSEGERRLFTGHITAPGALPELAVPLARLPYTRVAEHVGNVGTRELGLFLQGYVEGWIPDGWITLD